MTLARGLVPEAWLAQVAARPAEGGPTGAEWARGLHRLLTDLLDEWQLAPDGATRTGMNALVVPVLRDGEELALKVGWPHEEARHEALALRHWDGRGAVRLVAADPGRGALLLERLDATRDLNGVDVTTACEVVGGLLASLRVPAPPQVTGVPEWFERQRGRLATCEAVPRRMRQRVAGLADELLADGGAPMLLHTDLHYGNVLAGARAPWLAIDPKPLAGHPGVELQPLLRNRDDELGTGSAFRWSVRHRVATTCEAAGIEEDEGRAWALVTTGVHALWAAETGDEAALTLHIALLKALDG